MKLSSAFRYRRFVLAGMVVLALSCGARTAVLNAADAPAPAGTAANEIDPDSGKMVVTTPSGLKYVEIKVGTGPEVKSGDHLSVNYEGKLTNGTKFDSSYDRGQPFKLVLGETAVIQGWTEGLQGMRVGGVRKLIIPPQLGYGQDGMGDVIPPNATLIFKVEVVGIEPN